MLGSRFDLKAKLDELGGRRAVSGEAADETCVELERAITALAKREHEGAKKKPEPTAVTFRCPVCDDGMRLAEESDLGEFGGLDVKLHRLQCDTCGMLTGRVYHPAVGYHDRLVR